MSNSEIRPKNNSLRIILLFLLILLLGLGIWKCPNHSSEEASELELVQKKEDSLDIETSVKSTDVIEENTPIPTKKESIIFTKEESTPIIPTSRKNKEAEKIKKEATASETEAETAEIISTKKSIQEAVTVYNANKKIDKRLPATPDNKCKAVTSFKIAKSSIQTSVDISPDGSNFAVGNHNNYISVLDMEGKELLKLIGHTGYVQSIKYSPDGKFLASGSMDNTAKLWDAKTGKEIKSLKGHSDGLLCIAYSKNGKYIATGSLDHTMILWDVKSGKQLFQLAGHKSEIAEVAFSTNSKFVITGSSDGTAKIWDVENGKILYSLEGHKGVVGGVAFTPNDKLIITSSIDKLRLWNSKTGKHIHTINDKNARIMSIFVSKDGEYISSSTRKGLIKIWKIKGGKQLCEYEGHSRRAREAIFHPTQNNTVISAGNDNTIRMWKFETE